MRTFLDPVDQVWHAGDIGNAQLLADLQNFKPTTAVFGNIDGTEIRNLIPEIQLFQAEKVKILMMHIGGYPGKYEPQARKLIMSEHPQIFISGHSHILKVIYDKQLQCLHLNPGAAGTFGFHKKRTMMRFTIDGNDIRNLEIWEKDKVL